MGVLRVLFPMLDRRSSERFRDARVRDSVVRSERLLAAHDSLADELGAIEVTLQRRNHKHGDKPCHRG